MESSLTATIHREESSRHEPSYQRMKRLNRARVRATWIAIVVLALLAPAPDWRWTLVGVILTLAGAGVRALAAATLVKISDLTTHGIYALTRNPLYLGNMISALGLATLGGHWGWIVVYLGTLGLIYWRLILAEEAYLGQQFGAEFEAYCLQVPRFLPWPPRPPRLAGTLSGLHFLRNNELRNEIALGTALLLLVLKAWWLPDGGTLWHPGF